MALVETPESLRLLLQATGTACRGTRAVTVAARATMKAWGDLLGIALPEFKFQVDTKPLPPAQLTEMQACPRARPAPPCRPRFALRLRRRPAPPSESDS
jgi:hypothetical protein